jgi:hypothetical protein
MKKRKYEAGEAANFVSRKQAMRKLQLNLKVSPQDSSHLAPH